MLTISDFKIPSSVLKRLCRANNVDFIDMPVVFDESKEGAICIKETKNIAHTFYMIVAIYIENSLSITGKELFEDKDKKEKYLISMANSFRYFIYKDNKGYEEDIEPHSSRLYQKGFIWILLKDIICPIYHKEIENIQLIYGDSKEIDIAQYFDKNEVNNSESFIFVNNIDNLAIQNAFIFTESLKHFGLSPIEVLKKIYDGPLLEKFRGAICLAMEDDEVSDFESALSLIADLNLSKLSNNKYSSVGKIAQSINPYGGLARQWWLLGLTEQMLEVKRQENFSLNDITSYAKEFWDKVEEVKKKRIENNHDEGVPFDVLLRIKSKQIKNNHIDEPLTLQGLLSSNRVW